MADLLPRLSGPSHKPKDGPPRRLVILLHGVGADGQDLIGLAPHWAAALPSAEFVSPDAPFPCDMAPYGRQWFSLQNRDPAVILAGLRAAAPILDAFIDETMAARGLGEAETALVGFSQGSMMALFAGLRRPRALAGIAAFSGALSGPELLAAELRSRPPVLLVHGDSDEVVPPRALPAAAKALESAGVPVEQLLIPRLGHGIDETGLRRGAEFLARQLK